MGQGLRNWMMALCGGLVLVLAGCQSTPTPSSTTAPSASTPSSNTITQRQVGEYRLGADDQLRITVFGEPELSGEYLVDGTGDVSLPLIGEVPAVGRTVRELQRTIEARLADGYLRDPQVSAEVMNFRPYYVLGEVNRPGEYPYSNGLTVLNAIATAEGFSYRANQKIVMIKGADDMEEIRVELTPTTRVMPGDTIRVLERFF